MDPVTIVVAAVVVIVSVVVFIVKGFGSNDESGFDKAYNSDALKLISGQNNKQKSKPKSKPAKKNKEKSDSDTAEKTKPIAVAEPVNEEMKEEHTQAAPAPAAESGKKKNKKASQEENKENSKPAEEKKAAAPALVEPVKEEAVAVKSDESTEGKSKNKKKNKSKKEEPTVPIAEPEVTKKEQQPAAQSPPKPKKAKKPVVLESELDCDKVITRLSSVEELEPAYLSYLATFFFDSSAKTADLNKQLDSLQKSASDAKTKIDQHNNARLQAEQQLVQMQRQLKELQSSTSALDAAEKQAKQQLATLTAQQSQLKEENAILQKTLAEKMSQPSTGAQELAALQKEKHALDSRVEQLEQELASAKQSAMSAQKMEMELAKRVEEVDAVKGEFATLEALTRKMKAELDESRANKAGEVQIASSAEAERDQLKTELANAHTAWNEKETAILAEYESVKSLLEELNKEVANFENLKQEWAAKEQALVASEKSSSEAAKDTESRVLDENAQLKAQLTEVQARLAASESEHKNELERVVAESQKAAPAPLASEAEEEIVVLAKSTMLNAAPPSHVSSEEVESLKKENSYLNEKNEELRARNFKILDDVTELEKKLAKQLPSSAAPVPSTSETNKAATATFEKQIASERQSVVDAVSPFTSVKPPASDADSKKYAVYLSSVSADLKKKLAEAGKKCESKKDDKEVAVLREETGKYRAALSSLGAELARIESLTAEKDQEAAARIAELERKLNSQTRIVSTGRRLSEELRQCHAIKEQIESMKSVLTGEASPAKSSARALVRSEDEDEWEVVSQQ